MTMLSIIRRLYVRTFGLDRIPLKLDDPDLLHGQAASDSIAHCIKSGQPAMIARFGSIELDCLNQIRIQRGGVLQKYITYIKGQRETIGLSPEIMSKMENNTGFFPADIEHLDRFYDTMMEDIKQLDILGSWLYRENFFENELKEVKRIKRFDMEPYFHREPWSRELVGKRVLVVHPFATSIRKQYAKRDKLFANPEVLPTFELITYRPVQSIAGNYDKLPFKSWFEALHSMKADISAIDFDVAILGCGAYGFPLAAHIKRMGKQSIHLGGATQILFGIIGRRWETEYNMSPYVNEHWIRPGEDERPDNFDKIEGGCYW